MQTQTNQHTVVLTFDRVGAIVPMTRDGLGIQQITSVHPGDGIRWMSPHGDVEVTFKEGSSPLESGEKGNKHYSKIGQMPGQYSYTCTLIKDGVPDPPYPGGGGVEVLPI